MNLIHAISTITHRTAVALARLVCALLAGGMTGSAATVSGVVTDGSGKPVAGAVMTIQARPPFSTPYGDRIQSDSMGRFTFITVPAGTHEVCATPQDPTLIGSCAGAVLRTGNFFSVPSTSGVISRNITVTKGRRISVRISDPNSLAATDSARRHREIQLFANMPGIGRVPLIPKASPPGVYVYEGTLGSAASSIEVVAQSFDLDDDRANSLHPSRPIEVPSGTQDSTLTLILRRKADR